MATTDAAAPAAPAAPAAAAPAAPSNRVFVGNLPFKTTKEGLREFFGALQPTDATVAARGRRALGYGFVTFADEASAQQALKDFNDKELDGRALRLQPARPRRPQADREERKPRSHSRSASPYRNRPRRPRRAAGPRDAQTADKPAADKPAADKPATERPPRRPREGQPQSQSQPQGEGQPPRRPRRAPAADKPAEAAADKSAAAEKPAGDRPARRPRTRRPRSRSRSRSPRPAPIRVDNEKAFFVANLPFSVNDETLVSIFQQFSAVSGRVATRPHGRSKGFGFVEFATTAARDAAFDKLQEVVVGGRTLTIKKAVPVTKPAAPAAAAPAAAQTPKE